MNPFHLKLVYSLNTDAKNLQPRHNQLFKNFVLNESYETRSTGDSQKKYGVRLCSRLICPHPRVNLNLFIHYCVTWVSSCKKVLGDYQQIFKDTSKYGVQIKPSKFSVSALTPKCSVIATPVKT